jgi:hypothetical protein
MREILPIGLLLYPSLRSMAYLHVLHELNVAPREVILMGRPIDRLEEVRAEGERHHYSRDFFDLSLNLREVVESWGCSVHSVDAGNANAPEIHQALDRCTSTCFLFTGGGILSKETLSLGKSFVHSHPGYLPVYRGSTCFYYSLLADGSLGATLFVMDEKIDTGQIIARCQFDMNYMVEPSQPLFVDYVLDPYIRSQALKKGLRGFIAHGSFDGQEQEKTEAPAYYVMHPLLRHLSIACANRSCSPKTSRGVFAI